MNKIKFYKTCILLNAINLHSIFAMENDPRDIGMNQGAANTLNGPRNQLPMNQNPLYAAPSYTVNTNADAGPGSFRQAIDDMNTDIANSVPGPYTINFDSAYTITLGADVKLKEMAVFNTAAGDVRLQGAGGLTGAGGIIKEGAGNLYLTGGYNKYAGGTIINTGRIIGNTNTIQGDIAISTGGINFYQAFPGTFSGSISGNGDLSCSGGGTVTFDNPNANTLTGSIYVSTNSILRNGAPNAFSQTSEFRIDGGSTYDLNGFDQQVRNIQQWGAGSVGTVAFGGGTLTLRDTTGGASIITSGTGTIIGDVMVDGIIGTTTVNDILSINGNLDLGATGDVICTVSSNGNASLLHVNGSVDLNNRRLLVEVLDDNEYPQEREYVIIDSGVPGGLGGSNLSGVVEYISDSRYILTHRKDALDQRVILKVAKPIRVSKPISEN